MGGWRLQRCNACNCCVCKTDSESIGNAIEDVLCICLIWVRSKACCPSADIEGNGDIAESWRQGQRQWVYASCNCEKICCVAILPCGKCGEKGGHDVILAIP